MRCKFFYVIARVDYGKKIICRIVNGTYDIQYINRIFIILFTKFYEFVKKYVFGIR